MTGPVQRSTGAPLDPSSEEPAADAPDPGAPPHPLLDVLHAAADDRFPPVDGGVTFVPPLAGGLHGVVSFTGSAFVATNQPAEEFADLHLDGFGAALRPAVLLRLAGRGGEVGVVDVTLVARGLGGGELPVRGDLGDNRRVRHARTWRRHVRVYGDDRGLVTLARGVAGRTEMSVEVSPDLQGQRVGTWLITEALRLAPVDEPVFAAVAPGNARSLRAFAAVGFRPIGSEVLIRPG